MDTTTLNLLIGAGLVLGPSSIAWVAGLRAGRAVERRAAAAPPALVCSCEHGYGTHDREGACGGATKRMISWTDYGEPQPWEWVSCPCHVYDGPEPLPRSWSAFPLLPDPFLAIRGVDSAGT